MLKFITSSALRLDEYLQEKLGRPYNVMLAVLLMGEIVRRAAEFPHKLTSKINILGIILSIIVEMALLIHQIGALDHHIARRSRSRSGDSEARH
jgi:hypothetical protein